MNLKNQSLAPEILDIETLMQLEQSKSSLGIIDKKQQIEIEKLNKTPGNLICQRCHDLKYQQKLINYKGPLPANYAGSTVLLADHVNKMDRGKILDGVLGKIYPHSIIIKVVDIANFEGS